MNKERRKAIAAVKSDLDILCGQIDDLKCQIEMIRDEEQEVFDNMPEGFQEGERGEKAQAAIDAFDEAISMLEEFNFADVESSLDTASE